MYNIFCIFFLYCVSPKYFRFCQLLFQKSSLSFSTPFYTKVCSMSKHSHLYKKYLDIEMFQIQVILEKISIINRAVGNSLKPRKLPY